MEASGITAQMGEDQFEEWFLAGLSAETIPLDDMLGALDELRRAGMTAQADSWAELLEDSLEERDLGDAMVRAVRNRAAARETDPAFRRHVEKRIHWAFRNDPLRKKFVGHAGFAKTIPMQECFRRLDTLLKLQEGVLGLDRTWGIGRVRSIDPFYERVTIDFVRKRGHEMSMAYAAEAIQFVSDDHLQARHFLDPAGLKSLAEQQPAEVVRIALRSHGAMPVSRLQEILTDGILTPGEWKTFWEAARKTLKNDPLVVIPVKRSDPIQLLDREINYDARWFELLAKERTIDAILSRIEELQAAMGPTEADDAGRHVVADRLQFLLKGFGDTDVSLRVKVVLSARQWNLPEEWIPWQSQLEGLLLPDTLLAATVDLPAKKLSAFVEAAAGQDEKRTQDAILKLLPRAPMATLNVFLDFLIERGVEGAIAGVFREELARRQAGVEMVLWLARHPEKLDLWGIGTAGDLMFHVLPLFERTYTGERLKAANQLGELVQQRKWLEAAVESMNEVQQTSIIRMLKTSMGRIPLDTQAMIGRICISHPHLARLLEESREESAVIQGGLTSWRSYKNRQKQLEKLVNEDIPKNSRDIGIARSYGDLRENFEYKTAKEQQGILLRRRAEWEQDLNQVRGTDFSGSMADKAGMGTSVCLRYQDGSDHWFYILGEWDQEPSMGIISCSSKLGKALAGRKSGDNLFVPGEQGDMEALILKVDGLPLSILEWAKGQPA